VITDNIFDADTANGITAVSDWQGFYISSHYATLTDNTIEVHTQQGNYEFLVNIDGGGYNDFSGNTFNVTTDYSDEDLFYVGGGAHDNTISPNTINKT